MPEPPPSDSTAPFIPGVPKSQSAEQQPSSHARAHMVGLFGTLLILFGVFYIGFQDAVEPFFPAGYDQVDHRWNAMMIADQMTREGVSALINGTYERATAQGFVHVGVGGIATYLGMDPTYPFFGMFLASLAIIWWAMSDRSRHPWRGWTAICLILAMNSLTIELGSAIDFRPDFPGQTLWTTVTALALASRGFRDRSFTLFAGALLAVVFCTRSLTLAYTVAGLPALILAAWFGGDKTERRARFLNLGIGIVIALVLALPYFIACYEKLSFYYFENHLSEKEIAARGSTGGFTAHLAYYWETVWKLHLGGFGKTMVGLVFFSGLLCNRFRSVLITWPTLLIGLAFCMPIFVMSMGPHYSYIVAGSYAGSLVLLALIPWLGTPRRLNPKLGAVVLLSLPIWPYAFLSACDDLKEIRSSRQHQLILTALDKIIERCDDEKECVISTLHLIGSFWVPILQLRSSETGHGIGEHFVRGLGHGIYRSDSEAELLANLRKSDFVGYWVWEGGGGTETLPVNQEVDEHREKLEKILREEFRRISPDDPWMVENKPLELYERQR